MASSNQGSAASARYRGPSVTAHRAWSGLGEVARMLVGLPHPAAGEICASYDAPRHARMMQLRGPARVCFRAADTAVPDIRARAARWPTRQRGVRGVSTGHALRGR